MKIIILSLIAQLLLAYEIKSFSANFIQKIQTQNSYIQYKGECYITQNNALWNYNFPNKKQILINKKEAIIIEHDLEQVIYSKLDDIPDLNNILKNTKQINSNLMQAKYKNTLYDIFLENNIIKKISYKDELDNQVFIEFYNQKQNEKINNEIFKAKIPKNYDLIN